MKRLGKLRIVSCSSLALAAGLGLTTVGTAFAANPAPAAPPAPAASPAPAPATPPAPAAPAAAPPPTAAAPMPPPPPPPGGVPAAQAATPPIASEAMPATREEKLPPIDVGAWVRAAGRLQGNNPQDLDGARMDTVYAELHTGGKIHKNVSVTLNLNATSVLTPGGPTGTVGIEDAIIGFDMADPLHLWIGQLLVPVDRANFAGPFFSLPWNFPGFITVGPKTLAVGPMEGPTGRNSGGSLWGNDPDGKIKYAVGAFLPGLAGSNPLISGRVSTALIGKETGYFGNESFYGKQDIVTIGIGGQYKKDGSVGTAPTTTTAAGTTMVTGPAPTDNYAEFNADALAEFRYGDGGWVTLEGAYYHFAGQYNQANDSFFVTAAVATPKVGIGNIQPLVRYQQATGNNPNAWTLDAGVAYIMMGPALRAIVNYQHADIGNGSDANAVQFGAQAIFF
jgi:hypothetical protein